MKVASSKSDVLLTYSWVRSTYTAVRSFQRLGLHVHVADASRVGMGQWSRKAAYAGGYASPLKQPEQFVCDVVRLLERTGAHFLLPGHDETEVLAKYRHLLPAGVTLPVADHEKIALANNKALMIDLAYRLDVPVPKVFEWKEPTDLRQRIAADSSAWVVKLRRGNSAKGVFYPASAGEVPGVCETLIEKYALSPERYPVVQERVSGDGWGVSCLYWQGQRLASFTHRRLREKTATGGTSTLRISERNPVLEQMAHTLLDSLEWHGLAMVEFKYDAAAKCGWFIEINPRLWGSIHLAVASGVDFPALLYRTAIEGPQVVQRIVQPQREGIVARWYLGDLIASVDLFRRGQLANALRAMWPLGGADTLDDVFVDDLGAFAGEVAYYLSTFLRTRNLNPEVEGMLG